MTEVARVPFPRINPNRNQIIAVFGRKGSGKSVQAREIFRAWPGVDKLVIDPTGDADPGADLGTVTFRKLPARLSAPQEGQSHVVARYIADPGAPTYKEDLDRSLSLALYPKDRRRLVWVDEAGEVFPVHLDARPNARILLQQSRHWYTSLILCAPRPITLSPLCLAQADRVICYDMPNPADRERIANAIGWAPKDFAREMDETRRRGPHWSMLYVASEHGLYRCPPVVMSAGYKHAQH